MNASFDTLILERNPDAVVVLDPSGVVQHWSSAAHAIFGHSAEDATGHALRDLILAPDQREAFDTMLGAIGESGSCIYEAIRYRKDGSCLHIGCSVTTVRSADGALEHFILTKRDVTTLKIAREIKLVEAKYRELLDFAPDALMIVNVTGQIVMVNERAYTMYGYTREELIGRRVDSLVPKRFRRNHIAKRREFFEKPGGRADGVGLEMFGRRRNREEFPVEVSLSPLETDEGTLMMCAVRDIADRKEAQRKADRKFRDLLESAPDAMVIVDEQGKIVFVNSQTVKLFGWSPGELLGESVETLLPARFRSAHPAHRSGFFQRPISRQMGAGHELFGLRKDGTEFAVEVYLSPIETEDGLLIASSIRDASDRKRTELLLQETNRLKSEFLANMSHELRTPLNGILGFSDLLRDNRVGPLNIKQRQYVDAVQESGKHLLQLINDVLDLSKVEAGKMQVFAETFAPLEAITAVLSAIAPIATKKRITLEGPAGDGVEFVTLDAQKFKQILFNLLSNAIKFTDPGGKILVDLQEDGADMLRLTVSDTGIGIAPKDVELLFEAFHQVDGGSARQNDGTGLGLALTQRLVELQGGSVEVHSEPGVGSQFSVRLPLMLPKPQEPS